MIFTHFLGSASIVLSSIFALPAAATARTTSLSRRLEKLPWIDYVGIELAARDALSDELHRSSLVDSSSNTTVNKTPSSLPKCKKISRRKEWRELSYGEKKGYIRATKCLMTKGDYGISSVTDTLYDAFTQVHTTKFDEFHINAAFLPWHRWFVWIHNEALVHECGYSGPAPYWDFTKDYKNPTGSPIFSSDPEVGFGTHGTTVLNEVGLGGYKVDNGAFANFIVNTPIPHYLTRNFSYWKDADPNGVWGYQLGESYSPQQVERVLTSPTYWDLEINMEALNVTGYFGIHNSPHYMGMGDWTGPAWVSNTEWVLNGTTAPNDPMFWPHHQNVDRVFWKWQQKRGKQWEYNGFKSSLFVMFPDFNITAEPAYPTDILPFHGLGPDIPVALALKTENWPMCYTY